MLPKHIVKTGETLTKIAAQHKVRTAELKMTNLFVKNWKRLPAGTTLYLPSTYEYRAKAGETLEVIAKKVGMSVEQVHLYNPWLFPREKLQAGEFVWIPRSKFRIHTVRQGETLSLIANQNGVSLAELVAMSAPLLADPMGGDPLSVVPGMKVAIPVA